MRHSTEDRTAGDGIHDPRRAEELLRTGALQDAIVNSANFSSIATDAGGVIQLFNVGAERMLGYTAAEVVNRVTLADLSDPDELIARAQALSIELETPITPGFAALVFKASRGIEDIYGLTCIRKDGSRFPVMLSVTALRDAADQIIGYLLIGTDNTARLQVAEERRTLAATLQQNAALANASRMKSAFLATMSHELRTPLNAIIGFSEVLRDGMVGDLTVQQRGFIGDIFTSGQHLLALINDILDLSKVEAGMMALDLEPVRVSSLFSNALSMVREHAVNRGITLSTSGAEECGSILADGRKVRQIVYNLLSNAVKFTPDGGTVMLHGRLIEPTDAGFISGIRPGRVFPPVSSACAEYLEISVIDSGIGISPVDLEQLFRPFTQIDSSLARKFEGTGLGLAMVKLLAELHEGGVSVESSVDAGSAFTVWLPARAVDASGALPAEHPGATSVPAEVRVVPKVRRALVVENDPCAAELVLMRLESEGFEVLLASTAEAGLALAAEHELALITLDIMLPGMDGWAFLTKIKEDPSLRRIPVVITSIVAHRQRGFALGAAAVMGKPLSRQDFHDTLMDIGLFPAEKGDPLTVLIVDDDPKAVELIAIRMLGIATRILRARSGAAAIMMARRDLPDLIVLDLMMPNISGFDVVDALSASPQTSCIPVIVITAKDVTAEERSALAGSVSLIMEKSAFDGERLVNEVRRAMAGRGKGA